MALIHFAPTRIVRHHGSLRGFSPLAHFADLYGCGARLVVAVDDEHIGETGHEVKRTLVNLAALLDAVDKQNSAVGGACNPLIGW